MTVTASKLELAMLCPSAFALPHADVRGHGSDPERGKEEHAEHEATIKAGGVPEDLERRWPGYTWQAEVKVWYDLASDTGGIHGYGSDRGYEDRGPFVVFGTADAIGVSPDGAVAMVDRKGYNEQTPADRNAQVAILALAVTRHYRAAWADVAIAPKAAPMDVARLEAMDLDAFAAQARAALSDVMRVRDQYRNGLPLRLNEGKHCTYCPAVAACPAKQALALMLRGEAPLRLNLANDNDPADGSTILTAVLVSGPSHATSFTLNADGSFTYTPPANYNGSDSFTYKALDANSAESNVATVTITINPINDASPWNATPTMMLPVPHSYSVLLLKLFLR